MTQTPQEKAIHAKKGIKPNPKFKRIKRITTNEQLRADLTEKTKRVQKLGQENLRARKTEERRIAEENRPRDEHGNVIGLAQLTDKFMMEGMSEDDAFREAKNTLGLR